MIRRPLAVDSHAFVATLGVRPNERLRALLTRFLDHGRCPSCGYRSIVQFQRSHVPGIVLSCRTSPCGCHAVAGHFRMLLTRLGAAPVQAPLIDADDPTPFEQELHTILTEIVRHELCPACGVHGALVREVSERVQWSCAACAAEIAPQYFEVWRYLQSRDERGLPYRPFAERKGKATENGEP